VNRDLLKRLERLETIAGEDDDTPTVIIRRIVGKDLEPLPVLGWLDNSRYQDPLRIMRRPGESDEELEARAIEEARARRTDPRGVPCLLAIVE
jgi:hypothetical protein